MVVYGKRAHRTRAAATREAGHHGRAVLLRCLQTRSKIPFICQLAGWELDRIDAADPHVEAFAEILLNPAAELDRHEKKDIPEKVVAGMNAANTIRRITLLVHKLRAHIESEQFFYIDDHVSIADPGEERRDDVVRTLIGALMKALGKAIDLGLATKDLLETIKTLPQNVQDHVQAWVRTNTKDIECQELIEFVVKAIQERRPTGDDLLLVDAIVDRFGVDAAADVWQEALGVPPDPVTLGTAVRQNPPPDNLIQRWFWSVILPAGVGGSWRETQTILGTALGRIDRDYFLRPRSRVTSMWGDKSPFETADLESKPPRDVAELIAAWKPTNNDSWELRSARGVGRQLEEIVKRNPMGWAESPVEMVATLRHPTYVAHFFTGLAAGAESLADIGDRIIEAIDFARTHPWAAEPLGGDTFDYDHDWKPADESGVDLIKALAQRHIPLEAAATQRAWAIVIAAARDRGAPSSILGSDTEPLTSAINRPCTRALDTIVALIEYEYKRSRVVLAEALAVLTESLRLEGRDGSEHRAILGPRIPFLRHVLPQWFEANFDLLLGSKAPPGLAQETIDLRLRWGRADEWMLERFRSYILDAVRRESERALEGFLLGMFWDIPGYDAASCVRDLASLGPEHVSASGETAARMVRYDDTPLEIIQRGIALWEEALRKTPQPKALKGFGWWAEVPTIDSNQWESLTLETCEKIAGDIDWAPQVAERASSQPASAKALRILTLLVQAPLDYWERYRVADHAMKALTESPVESSTADARDDLRRALLEHGHFKAGDIQ